ncbi:hypothetical protein CEP53_011964 [Fusarium sp. AF-6]|nr:hypothetical protein CEP53_011964 [Fusarium sp. AF-6]
MFITRGMRQVPDRHSPDVELVTASLGLIAASGDVERLRHLLAAEDESPPSEETIQFLLASASWAERIPVIEFLLAEYPPGKVAEEPIRAAIYSGSMPLISVFLRADPSVLTLQYDRQGSALIAACRSRQRPEFIRFLLEAGADPNQDPDCAYLPPLGWAAGWYQKSYPVPLEMEEVSESARFRDSVVVVTEKEAELISPSRTVPQGIYALPLFILGHPTQVPPPRCVPVRFTPATVEPGNKPNNTF